MRSKQLLEISTILNEEKTLSFFSASTKMDLLNCSVITTHKPNQHLWHFGDPGDFCTLILKGLVEIVRPTGSDEDTCMGIFGKNDVIGLSALLNKTAFPANAKTLDETKTLRLYIAPLIEQEKTKNESHEISNWIRDRMLSHETILREKIDILTAGTTEDRLRELFRHLLRRFGSIHSGCRYQINVKLSKTKAARLMGIRSETAIRLINDWQRKKLIDWSENHILIHNLDMIDRFILQNKCK